MSRRRTSPCINRFCPAGTSLASFRHKSMRVKRSSCLIVGAALLLIASLCAYGQDPGGQVRIDLTRVPVDKTSRGSIQGRVTLPGGGFIDQNLRVTLLNASGPLAWSFTENQGRFEFANLAPGNYEVQVDTGGVDYQVVSESVQVLRGAPAVITIALKDKPSLSRKMPNGVVSATELNDSIPKAARKEFMLANAAIRENKTEDAIAHLRKAIDIYPAFVMARSDLGVQLFSQGKLDEAEEQFREAIKTDPAAFNPRLNLGMLLVEKSEFAEAVVELNRAISFNSESAAAHLYAGVAYVGLAQYEDAEKHLKSAYTIGGTSYSLALYHLGRIYINKGEREAALKYFQEYLRVSPDAPNAHQVQKLIAMLQSPELEA